MLGYRPVKLIVSDTLNAREFITGIYMHTDTLEIGEVIIIPRFTNLKTEIINSALEANTQMDNARNNITIASYQGRTGQGKLGSEVLGGLGNKVLSPLLHGIDCHINTGLGGHQDDRTVRIARFENTKQINPG